MDISKVIKASLRVGTHCKPHVLPHPELSRLPKSPTALRSLKFRKVLPGSSEPIIFPGQRWNPKKSTNPDHPSLKTSPRDFPRYASHLFSLRCYPNALLQPYDKDFYPFADTPSKERPPKRQAHMGLISIVSKKFVHSSAVVRVRIKLRTKEALRLVIVRGAYTSRDGTVQFNEGDIGESKWLLKEWAYILQPTLEAYRNPLEGLIFELRKALKLLMEQGTKLELQWSLEPPSGTSGDRVMPNNAGRHSITKAVAACRTQKRRTQ